jgi:phosphohistidine phosphatase
MDLYLMQHGEAKAENEDPERPLTARGRDEVERVADVAGRLDLRIGEIRHSGKLRARQTADIMAARLCPEGSVVEAGGLSPRDDPGRVADELAHKTESVLLVGHLPHLGRLTARLLTGQDEPALLSFRMAALVALRRDPEGWRLAWVLTPEMAAALASA